MKLVLNPCKEIQEGAKNNLRHKSLEFNLMLMMTVKRNRLVAGESADGNSLLRRLQLH